MLGIFRTKKAKNNKLILKSLVTGPKTTKQVAEYIYFNRKQPPRRTLRKAKEPNENEVRKIVSVVSRKDSRLDELKAKDYIFRENNLWNLTLKGMCVALTQIDSIMEDFPYIDLSALLEDTQKELYKQPFFELLLKTRLRKEDADNIFNFGKSPEYVQFTKDFTNGLIKQGVDLDRMNETDFLALLVGKLIPFLYIRFIRKEGVKP